MDQLYHFINFDVPIIQKGGGPRRDNSNSILKNVAVVGGDIFRQVKDVFILWIIVPIVFGTLVPAFPFFIVLAVLHGIFKYILKMNLYK